MAPEGWPPRGGPRGVALTTEKYLPEVLDVPNVKTSLRLNATFSRSTIRLPEDKVNKKLAGCTEEY